MIYVLYCMGHVKIGHSKSPESRFRAAQVLNPYPVSMLFKGEGGKADETALHERFSSLKVKGDWFRHQGELIDWTNEICQPATCEPFASYLKAERGNLTKLAASIGVTPSAIAQWDKIPADRLIEVERATGIHSQKLRPDLFENMEIHAGDTQAH